MARKVSPELLAEHQGELGIWKSTKKGREFDALLNFNFDVTTKVSLGEQLGSGAVYVVRVPGEETRFVCSYLCNSAAFGISKNKRSAGHCVDKSELVYAILSVAT